MTEPIKYVVNQVECILDNLFAEHSEDNLEVLKQTLREIRARVQDANSKADALINKKILESHNCDQNFNQLKQEFPELGWKTQKSSWGWVSHTGSLELLQIEFIYRIDSSKWEADICLQYPENGIDLANIENCESLDDCIKEIKSKLSYLQKITNQLSVK